ncbi:MAG: hypothetical protein ACRCYY_17865, partial [Trueperaceae bacterium]
LGCGVVDAPTTQNTSVQPTVSSLTSRTFHPEIPACQGRGLRQLPARLFLPLHPVLELAAFWLRWTPTQPLHIIPHARDAQNDVVLLGQLLSLFFQA